LQRACYYLDDLTLFSQIVNNPDPPLCAVVCRVRSPKRRWWRHFDSSNSEAAAASDNEDQTAGPNPFPSDGEAIRGGGSWVEGWAFIVSPPACVCLGVATLQEAVSVVPVAYRPPLGAQKSATLFFADPFPADGEAIGPTVTPGGGDRKWWRFSVRAEWHHRRRIHASKISRPAARLS